MAHLGSVTGAGNNVIRVTTIKELTKKTEADIIERRELRLRQRTRPDATVYRFIIDRETKESINFLFLGSHIRFDLAVHD